MQTEANHLYRRLPQVGEAVERAQHSPSLAAYSRALVTDAARAVLQRLRLEVKAGRHTEATLEASLRDLVGAIQRELQVRVTPSLRRVINATGVILQTNLGRAPLSEAAVQRIAEVGRGYCNVEMDLETGERSRRDVHVEGLILDVIASRAGVANGGVSDRAAAVVNNCAAATFLALNTLAEGGEVIVSRGELVEIGGGFRIPEILQKSGAKLREVGTTNRTRLGDYAAAITPETRLILRVHRSNFRIEGFTERPSLSELLELGVRTSLPVFDDQGTGCIVDLDEFGIRDESSWVESASSAAAMVACSGDKLLGGPQCGLLVGSRVLMEQVRANPLFRALRVDKLTYAALEATLLAYLRAEEMSIPAIAMLRMPAEAVRQRCERWAESMCSHPLVATVVPTRSLAGGGTTPGASLPSYAVALQHAEMNESALASRLRELDPPVIARVSEGQVLLDLRTVPPYEDDALLALFRATFSRSELTAASDPEGAIT